MSKRTARDRAEVARETFIATAQERGLTVSPVDASRSETSAVEWRFADGDPDAPTIRTSFITRAEAAAVLEEGEAALPPTGLFLLHGSDRRSTLRARAILESILSPAHVEVLA